MALDKAKYGESEHGNFFVKDTIGVPHPYCITGQHVTIAADHFGGMLEREAIVDAERRGAKCGICKGKLTYAEHETALLIGCKAELKIGNDTNPELHAYLLKCKPICEADGYVGFAFVKEAQ